MEEKFIVPGEFREYVCDVSDLNNFVIYLPDGQQPEIPGEPRIGSGHLRRLAHELGLLDKKPPIERMDPQERQLHGPLFLGQTYRDFFVTIDEAIAELGLNSMISQYFEAKRKIGPTFLGPRKDPVAKAALQQSITLQKQFYLDVMPLYVCLRKKGYSWYDLTG